MAQKLVINADNPTDLLDGYGVGALIRIERSTLPDSGFSEVLTEPIVATVSQYEVWDPTGASSHYYKTRYTSLSGALSSEYSAAFRAGSLSAYATLDDLKETMNLPNDAKDNMLSDLLVDASNYLDMACRRDFYRHPQVSGTETRIYNVMRSGQPTLSSAVERELDIVSVSLLEASDSTGGTYTTIASGATGYYLSPRTPSSGWPYEDVHLSDAASVFRYFPTAYGAIQITGVFGWASVPPLIKRATLDLAREWYRQGPGGGGPIGVSALGQPQYQQGNPPSVRQAVELYRRWSLVVV